MYNYMTQILKTKEKKINNLIIYNCIAVFKLYSISDDNLIMKSNLKSGKLIVNLRHYY